MLLPWSNAQSCYLKGALYILSVLEFHICFNPQLLLQRIHQDFHGGCHRIERGDTFTAPIRKRGEFTIGATR